MKYGNTKTCFDGIVFDSKAEVERYMELRLLERAGEIKDLQRQTPFLLQPSFKKHGKTYREIKYIADFTYFDVRKGKNVVEDVKGYRTEVFRLKKKLFEYKYPDLEITEVKA